MKILVDMDGVITDLEATISRVMQETPWHIDPADRVGFYAEEDYRRRFGDKAGDTVRKIFAQPGIFLTFDPISGAIDALNKLTSNGHNVKLCTSPLLFNPTCASDKLTWVKEHLGEFWMQHVIITRDKTWVQGDLLIDDKPQVTGTQVPSWKHVLFRAPYNSSSIQDGIDGWMESTRLSRFMIKIPTVEANEMMDLFENMVAELAVKPVDASHRQLAVQLHRRMLTLSDALEPDEQKKELSRLKKLANRMLDRAFARTDTPERT